MFSFIGAATVWSAFHLRLLAFALAAQLHPGAETFAAPFLDAAVAAVQADPEPLGGEDHELALMITFAHDESDFGRALSGRRWDSQAFGVLQVRGDRALEHDVRRSAREWLARLHASAKLCGEERAVAGLASGRCDRALDLAKRREREAAVALATVASTD